MNPIDDMFRKGLDGRPGEVPADMWSRVQAGNNPPAPDGPGIDKLFSDGLKDYAGQVPEGMWSRIAATGLPAAAAVDQVFTDGLKDRSGDVPAGLWDKIWKARKVAPRVANRRWAIAAAVLLLLLAGWWIIPEQNTIVAPDGVVEIFVPEDPGSETATGGDTSVSDDVFVLDDNPASDDVPASENEIIRSSGTGGNIPLSGMEPFAPVTDGSKIAIPGITSAGGKETGATLRVSDESVSWADDPTAENLLKPADGTLSSDNTPSPGTSAGRKTATAMLPAGPTLTDVVSNSLPAAPRVKGRYRPKPSNDRAFRAATRHRFQMELLFGAAYADQQFTPTSDANLALRDLREVSEFPELSYQVSLRGAYKLNERLIFLGGLTYAEIRNQFEYERTIAGETTKTRTNNTIRMLEAPLLLGYRLPGRRLQVSVNAGPVVNLATSAQGRFLDPDSPQPLDLATDGNYRRNVGVGFMTSLSTTYQIGKKEPFVLLVEPFFKAYPTSFTTAAAPVKETYWVAGLQLGVRKGF